MTYPKSAILLEPENRNVSLDMKFDYVTVLKYMTLADPLPIVLP